MKSIEKMLDPEKIQKLKEELLQLRKYLNYKNVRYCKKLLEDIIKKYFEK